MAEHKNPKGGYFPPFRQSDLPAGQYWSQGRHADGNFQRWAYDLGVERWTGSGWTALEQGGDSDASADYLIYGEPVYAMSDGEIIGCNRGAPDNADWHDIVGNVPGGNILWVRTGNETTLYAHLRKNSIPFGLCPFSNDQEHPLANPNQDLASDNQYEIEAGEFLGEVGTSGSSRDKPHLHIHSFRGLPKIWGSGATEAGEGADGRPLKFFNARVHPKDAEDVSEADWNLLDPAAQLPYNTRVQGNPCRQLENPPDDDEEVRLEIPSRCFGDVYNTMTYKGMRIVHIDVTETTGARSWTTVWRSAKEAGTSFYYGIDGAAANKLILGSTDRVLELESYRIGNALRFALIMVDDPQAPQQFSAPGETAAGFGKTFAEETAAGLFPVAISVTEVLDVAYISTVYEKAEVGSLVVNAGIPVADYGNQFNANAAAGRSLAWVESHVEDGQVRLAAIWYENLTGPYAASGVRSLAQIEGEIATHVANGGYTRSLTGYQLGGNFSYLGLWRWPPTEAITQGPRGTVPKTKATFGFKRSDPFSTSECRLDGAKNWKPCQSPKTYSGLLKGSHTFRVRAISREQIPGAVTKRSWKVG